MLRSRRRSALPPPSPLLGGFGGRRSRQTSVRRLALLVVIIAGVFYLSRPTELPEQLRRSTSVQALKQAANRYLPALRVVEHADSPHARGEMVRIRKEPVDLDSTRQDGRVVLPELREGFTREHPIPKLMERAKKRWTELRARQSKTFGQAVKEYRRRTGRNPPKGFDRWYAFCRNNNVIMIDEFDMINTAIRPFFAFSPANFRKRVDYVSKPWPIVSFGWGLEVKKGKVTAFGNHKDCDRAWATLDMMERFVHELPDFKSYHTANDGPHIYLNGDERKRLEDLVDAGRFDTKEDGDPDYLAKAIPPPIGPMPQTCPEGTPMRKPDFNYGVAANNSLMPPLPDGASTTFIGDIRAALDLCRSPHYRHTHSAVSWTFPLPGPHLPLFSPGVHGRFADLPAIVLVEEMSESDFDTTPWEARTDSRLLWRGQTSGPNWLRQWPWKSSQRARIHLIAQDGDGTPSKIHLDAKNGSGVYEIPLPAPVLNAAFLDVGMVGPAVQCDRADGTCDEMTRVFKGYKHRVTVEESKKYKFELDVDGNSWSGRFRRIMLSSAVPLKATIFPAYWHDWAIPWYHYVPIQVDYSDLHDTLAYFRGAFTSFALHLRLKKRTGGLYGEDAHDEDAKAIALAGQAFGRDFMRYEDMEAYTFRLYLEYARLYSDERRADGSGADYVGEGDEEPVW